MTKKENREDQNSCWNKAGDDEPVFVLRAKDPIAGHIINIWAALSFISNTHEPAKCKQAVEEAKEMDKWHLQNVSSAVLDEQSKK